MLNRNFLLIVLSSIVLGAPMPMLILLGALAGQSLAPAAGFATVPSTVQILAGIIVAIPVSMFMGKSGRRSGFLAGAACMVAGGLLAMLALEVQSFVVLCLAHFILGAALICVNFFRFAAAESVPEKWRAKAISYTLASGLIAALIGPLIYTQFRDALLPIPFAGAYLALSCLGLLACIPLSLMDKMIPGTGKKQKRPDQSLASKVHILRRPVVLFAVASAAVAQASMVLLMIPTPLAMEAYGHDSHHAADVIRWHVVAMFAPGIFTGSLIQRFGAVVLILAGFVLLIGAGLVAFYGTGLLHFYCALVFLGIGWNFGFIGGTYLLQSVLSEHEQPLVQGVNDTILAVASSIASLSSGLLYAGFGWPMLAVATVIVLVLVTVVLVTGKKTVSAL